MEPNQGGNYWQGKDTPETQDSNSFDDPSYSQIDDTQPLEAIEWEASEYIDHDRDTLWFVGFIAITVVLILFSLFLAKNYFFTVLVIVMAVALLIYTKRPPQVVHYSLNEDGLMIGQKFYSFDSFRAFGILEDGALFSVRLLPVARFGQETTVYFSEEQGEKIVDILGSYLPMEELHLDLIDRLLRRLRL